MPVNYGKGAKAKATKLHSLIIRSKAECERCGATERLQTAHIISRMYSATRTDLDNAFCLCAKCHFYFTKWPVEFAKFVEDKIGLDKYEALKRLATSGIKVDWEKELERLEEIKCHL